MAELYFKNHYQVNRDTYKEWDRLFRMKNRSQMIFRGVWFVIAFAAAAMLVYTLTTWAGFPVLPLVILGLCMFRGVILPPLRARAFRSRLIARAGREEWERNVLFGAEIVLKENQNTSKYSYQQIREVRTYEKWYAIVMQSMGVIYVKKGGFTIGNEEQFLDWLEKQRKSEVEEAAEI